MTPNDSTRVSWEQRAAKHQGEAQGVLLQGLPKNINQAINDWQTAIITIKLAPLLSSHSSVLDLAAGYGRLSQVIHALHPNAGLTGVDFSPTYCQLYAKEIGNAVCADLRQLPFGPNSWDGILLATGLMYLDTEAVEATVQQVLSGLKRGGVALFIEPGAEIMSLLRILQPKSSRSKTGGIGFNIKGYRNLFRRSGYRILSSGSNSIFTLFLPICLMFKRMPFLASAIAKTALRLDLFLGWNGRLALHRWVVVYREI